MECVELAPAFATGLSGAARRFQSQSYRHFELTPKEDEAMLEGYDNVLLAMTPNDPTTKAAEAKSDPHE